MTPLATLNRRLAESLGLVLGGSQGKYEWRETTECFYYFRPVTAITMQKVCWAERLGRGYVLCVWRLPEAYDPSSQRTHTITEQGWKEMFQGTIPYPGRGEYKALPETFTREVTPDLNQNYIWAIDKQAQQTFEDQNERINLEHAMDRDEWKQKFEDATFDAMPSLMSSESWMQR